MLYQMIYVSTTIKPLSTEELEAILEVSRKNNPELGITGLLIIKGRTFMQALEGEKEVVKKLYRRIEEDSRHTGVVMVSEREITERDFPTWSMGYKNLDNLPPVESKKMKDFTSSSLTEEEINKNPSLVKMMFQGFIEKK